MSNIYVEKKIPTSGAYKEPLMAASVTGYARGLAVAYTSGNEFGCTLATALGQTCLGIIEEDQMVGAGATSPTIPLSIVEFGPAVAQIGASVTAQQQLTTSAAGQLIPATSGQAVLAVALESQTYISPGSYAGVFVLGMAGPISATVSSPVTPYTASGAIVIADGIAALNAATPLVMTLGTPTTPGQDGVEITITAQTAHAHKVTTASNKINGGSSVITFANVGDSVTLQALGGIWTVAATKGTVSIAASATNHTAAGAIAVTEGVATIGGAAADAMTLVQPSLAQEGLLLFVEATTAHAHTLTTSADGINGVDDTVTFAAVGDAVLLQARNQVWIVLALLGATLSEV